MLRGQTVSRQSFVLGILALEDMRKVPPTHSALVRRGRFIE